MRKLFVLVVLALMTAVPLSAEQNKVAIITGASRGVGLATAELLAKNGFIVYGTVRSAPPKPSLDHLHFLQVDLLDESSILQTVQHILKKEKHIDILINNAGYAVVGPLEVLTEEEIHHQMEVNFFAPLRFMQAVLPAMRSQKSGHIMNISSVNAFATPPFAGMYAASKAALESVSESLCVEVQPFNISVSIVEPGFIQTHFIAPMGTKEIPNNPYKATTERIEAELQERFAHPERLSPSQTPQEVAEFLLEILRAPHPKLRYQTSEDAKQWVSKKLIDLTGDLYLNQVREIANAERD